MRLASAPYRVIGSPGDEPVARCPWRVARGALIVPYRHGHLATDTAKAFGWGGLAALRASP
jgi:hypothetical protein